ncbi:MAG: hypothetical protein KAG61_10855 [Bacteriovoracaceae bacterium]|nr:hypothetical protein [Bacteriovoracaceae bacterium]
MKKIALGLIALTLVSTSFAAEQATINLNGSVVATSSIQIESGSSADVTINVLDGSSHNLSAQEESNADAGYTVKGRSANGGLLHVNGDQNYAYTLTYAGTTLNLSSETVLKTVTNLTGKTTDNNVPVTIVFPAQADAPSGDYEDIVTLTIESN